MSGAHDGRTIGITGVSSGIGAATARYLKAAGARIVGFDRHPPTDAVDAFHPIDIADPASIAAIAAAIDEPLDAWCNIAGVPPTANKATVLKVNFFGLRHVTEAVAPRLADGAGIVNVASLAGFAWRDDAATLRAGLATAMAGADAWIAGLDIEGAPSYRLSKELVIAWTIADCKRWADRGIRLNSVSPGPVATPILDDFIATLGKRAEDDLRENRAATAEEIAPIVAFFCSPDACWINGANIAADGGAGAAIKRETYLS